MSGHRGHDTLSSRPEKVAGSNQSQRKYSFAFQNRLPGLVRGLCGGRLFPSLGDLSSFPRIQLVQRKTDSQKLSYTVSGQQEYSERPCLGVGGGEVLRKKERKQAEPWEQGVCVCV